jgi:hypothetical protein
MQTCQHYDITSQERGEGWEEGEREREKRKRKKIKRKKSQIEVEMHPAALLSSQVTGEVLPCCSSLGHPMHQQDVNNFLRGGALARNFHED